MMHFSCNIRSVRTIILLSVTGIFSYNNNFAQLSYKQDVTLSKLQNFKDTSDHHNFYPYNKKRVKLVALGNVAAFGSMLIGLNAAWYSQYPRSGFHFFNDEAEWLQVDKVGHAWSIYNGSKANMELWRWAGLPRKQRIWLGGLSGVAYGTVIETLDGFSSEYGFSLSDYAANIFGSGMFVAQEFAWDDQRIKLKFSFHKRNYHQTDLNIRADNIYGASEIERFLKDYNAQTYWLSANVHSFFPGLNFPKWLSVAAGYGADGMFGARSNIAVDKTGTVIFDRSDIKRYRQWYLAPDIDLTKIKTNKKSLKVILFVLSTLKFPAPALEFSNGSFKGHWMVF